jgi:myosin heavy subunit
MAAVFQAYVIPPAQAKRDRKKLIRDLDAGERQRHTAMMKELARLEAQAKKGRRDELAKAKGRCRAGVHEAAARAAEAYRLAREAAEKAWTAAKEARIAERHATKQAALDVCSLDRQHVEGEAHKVIEDIQRRADENRRHKRQMASIDRINRGRDKERSKLKATSAERRAEADDEVLSNLPDALIPLWNKVRRSIKGSDRRSRTEEFIEYAAENEDSVIQAQQEIADRELKQMEREYWQQQQGRGEAIARPLRRTRARASVAMDEAVPF